jgi:hypothetical protein
MMLLVLSGLRLGRERPTSCNVMHRPRPLQGRPPEKLGQRRRWHASPSKSAAQVQRPVEKPQEPFELQGVRLVCATLEAEGKSNQDVPEGHTRSLQSGAVLFH